MGTCQTPGPGIPVLANETLRPRAGSKSIPSRMCSEKLARPSGEAAI